jgi:hypothetical protein
MAVLQQKTWVIEFSTPKSAPKDVFGRANAKRNGKSVKYRRD